MTDPALTVRPRRVRVVAWLAAVLLVVVFTVVAVLLRGSQTGVHFRIADQVAMVGLGVLLAGAALLFTRPRLQADAGYVEVRNILTTQRFAWALVLAISFPEGAPWARLELPEDEYVAVMAIQAADGPRAVEAIRALREMHQRSRQR